MVFFVFSNPTKLFYPMLYSKPKAKIFFIGKIVWKLKKKKIKNHNIFFIVYFFLPSHKQTNKKFGFISTQSQFHNKISRKIPSPSSHRHVSEVFVV